MSDVQSLTYPFLPIGDLGTTAQEVEKSLETNFALANRWDCILLLDEADVFLAERTKLDFKRNGLVAGTCWIPRSHPRASRANRTSLLACHGILCGHTLSHD